MAKYPLSFVELHNAFFMNGSNLGNKINAAQRGAKLLLDDERNVVWIFFKQKVSFIPLASVASGDMTDIPQDIQELFGIAKPEDVQAGGPPAIARAKRGRPCATEPASPLDSSPAIITVPYPAFDPNDSEAAAKHRELVRAASANSNRASAQGPQNDDLIQKSRATAMGMKHQPTSQVSTAQQVGAQTTQASPRKIMSHAELQVKVAQDSKT